MTDVIRVKSTAYAVDSENKIYGWDANEYGQLGNDNTTDRTASKKESIKGKSLCI